ncbi:MAG: hypothetical protein AVDCRST_MAG39-1945, partial [uncultured Sphingomonadaceae bacterium]
GEELRQHRRREPRPGGLPRAGGPLAHARWRQEEPPRFRRQADPGEPVGDVVRPLRQGTADARRAGEARAGQAQRRRGQYGYRREPESGLLPARAQRSRADPAPRPRVRHDDRARRAGATHHHPLRRGRPRSVALHRRPRLDGRGERQASGGGGGAEL